MKHSLFFTAVLACAIGFSCDGGDDNDDASDDDAVDTDPSCTDTSCYAPCSGDTKVGEFKVDLAMELGYTAVDGAVYDGVIPSGTEVLQTTNECQLLGKLIYECDPPCENNNICTPQGVCIPFPSKLNLGAITIAGMKDPISIEPNVSNHYTNTGLLQHPGFDPGAPIRLDVAGGAYGPFSLYGSGISPLVIELAEVPFESGKDAVITWPPPAAPGPARVHLLVNLDQHGGSRGKMECHVDDTGSFTIPAALVTQLMDLGLSGFPSVRLVRRTVTSTTLPPGCVEFSIASGWTLDVKIPDLISCTTDADCPQGQTCQDDLTCG